jgi:peptide chain release factor 1
MRIELHPGTGGDESVTFAGELARAIGNWARKQKIGEPRYPARGQRLIIMDLPGVPASRLDFLVGVHRMQRIPPGKGGIKKQTSYALVVVADDPGVPAKVRQIPRHELEITPRKGSGPGGQSVNTTDSAVTVKHLPTGEVARCQDGRSLTENIDQAIADLARRLTVLATAAAAEQLQQFRLAVPRHVAFGHNQDRSEVVRFDCSGAKLRRWTQREFARGIW